MFDTESTCLSHLGNLWKDSVDMQEPPIGMTLFLPQGGAVYQRKIFRVPVLWKQV